MDAGDRLDQQRDREYREKKYGAKGGSSMRYRRFLATAATLCFFVLCAACAKTGSGPSFTLSCGERIKAVENTDGENRYDLFLPAGETVVPAADGQTVTIDGAALSGDPSADLFTEGTHTATAGKSSFTLDVHRSAQLPAVFIDTASGSLRHIHADKNHKESGTLRIYESGALEYTGSLEYIKGRGNSTWDCEKNPYNIKLAESAELLGMGEGKKWALLASYYDDTLLKNETAWRLAERCGLPFTSERRFVDLYVNGEYLGNYILCETVTVGGERVAIRDLEKANEAANPGVDLSGCAAASSGSGKGERRWQELASQPEDISGGYLLELDYFDNYSEEVCGFVTENGQSVALKCPQNASKDEVAYIADLWQQAEDAILSPNGVNAQGKRWEDYFDEASLVDSYLLNEFTGNRDAGFSSLFVYKDAGSGRFVFAPAWDFDRTFYTGRSEQLHACMAAYAPEDGDDEQICCDTLFRLLYKNSGTFRAAARERWQRFREMIDENFCKELKKTAERLAPSAVMDALRWRGVLEDADDRTAEGLNKIYQEKTAELLAVIQTRKAALDAFFREGSAVLFYDANGGDGQPADEAIYAVGDSATAAEESDKEHETHPPAGKHFQGWNTKKDGTGQLYRPGDAVPLETDVTVLYAVWE